jgi:hypothetical protein
MAEQRNGPGVPKPIEVQVQAKLKSIIISGTGQSWALGRKSSYLVPEKDDKGKEIMVEHIGEVVGMGIMQPPAEIIARDGGCFCQITIVYEDFKDTFRVADHLIIQNLHLSEIATPVPPKLVAAR